MKIYPVPPMAIGATWPFIESSLVPALKKCGTHDADDVMRICREGRCHLYIQVDDENKIHGAVIIDVVVYPKGKECRAWLAGSVDKPDWQEFVNYLLEEAKRNGCRWFSSIGRKGWSKFIGGQELSGTWKEIAT